MAGNRTPTQSWSAQTPPALQRNQEKYAESVALHSCVRYPSLIIISIAYLPHACVNCRRSAKVPALSRYFHRQDENDLSRGLLVGVVAGFLAQYRALSTLLS